MSEEIIDAAHAEIQQAVQSELDAVTRKLGTVGEIVTSSIEAGGYRASRGELGRPHLEDAMAVLGVITRNTKGRDAEELQQEIRMVDRCLKRAANAMAIDYEQI